MAKELRGVLTALPTPFTADDQIDAGLMQKVVDRSIDAGVDALVVGGGTGEYTSLTNAERRQIFEIVVEHTAGRVPVVAHTGSLTTREAVGLSRAAEATGADALMLITPFYERLTETEISRYVETVAGSVSVPIMLYNNPGVTGVNLGAEGIARFGREIDNIEYVKDSSHDWEQALRLIHHHRDDIKLIMGWDSFSFGALTEGAAGIMAGAANVVPNEIVAVVRAIREGDLNRALENWLRVFPAIDAMMAVPFTQAVKAGLRLQGLDIGSPRSPLADLEPDAEASLEAALDLLNH
ncbi:dihydrodipicolinate synthase family protein [Rhodococcus koreensis]|uniref:dihydrodipicolinate synthase family protein n=1 Tax=Rhodococcus koreensis TaxID=99653 RepID=UPI0019819CEA|nr:dihydrodipicolinate synthase family protein [Rhodococcus koreensis]QSE82935.1 dihydrodipicolinate synthase family protein [Rhodococcus koreensis]